MCSIIVEVAENAGVRTKNAGVRTKNAGVRTKIYTNRGDQPMSSVRLYSLSPWLRSMPVRQRGACCPCLGHWLVTAAERVHTPVGHEHCTFGVPSCSEIHRLISLVTHSDQYPLVTSRRLRRESCFRRGCCTGSQVLPTPCLSFRLS